MTSRFLVPLQLAPLSEAKLQAAQAHARAFDAEVLLLHVLPAGALDPGAVSLAEGTARAYLDHVVARLRGAGLRAEALLRAGPPAATIVEAAREQQADLIILGSDVRPRLSRALLGSVADELIR